MISVSEELKNAFNTGNQKDLTLYFSDNTSLTNENIVAESMSLEQILCDEEQITFGLCNSASFKITILNSNTSRVGQTVTPVISIRGTEYSMQLGVFKIVEDKVTDDRLHRNITAYDALYDIVNTDYASWYTSLTFPMTLKQFRDSFFTHIGLTQVSASLINDSMTVEKTVDVDVFSGSDILKAICELNAVFGCIDNEGNFKYIPFVHEGGLYPEEDLFPADDLYPNDGFDVIVSGSPYSYVSGSFVYEDYVVQRITGLAIVEEESDTSELYGTDENLYMITGNYLLFGKNATDLRTVAENFLGFVGRFQYKPARIRMRAMPWVELGDIIGVVGKKGNAVFPILKRTMSGITALYDDYEAHGKEYYSFSANTVSSMVEKLKSKTMRIVANVDEVSTELSEYETQTDGTLSQHSSRIQQNATSISSEVTRATGAEGDLSSRITQTADSITSEVTRATGAEGDLSSRISQSAHTIDLSVSGTAGQETSAGITISLYDENGNLLDSGSGNITLDGNVIFKSNLTDGQTVISGDNITTGTLSANRVRSGALVSNNGTMSIDLDNNTITASTLVVNATNFQLDANGTVTATGASITGDITANHIYIADSIKMFMSTYYTSGYSDFLTVAPGISSAPWDQAKYQIHIPTGEVAFELGRFMGTFVQCNGRFTANSLGTGGDINLGTAGTGLRSAVVNNYLVRDYYVDNEWTNAFGNGDQRTRFYSSTYIYSNHSIEVKSDRRLKEGFKDLDELENAFNSLKPVSFLLKTEKDRKRHIGFVSQDVQASLNEYTEEGSDGFAIVDEIGADEDMKEYLDGNKFYALCYDEFIALNTHMIQKLQKRVNELEEKVNG